MSSTGRTCPDCQLAMTFGSIRSRWPGVKFHEHGELLGDPWGDKITGGILHRAAAFRCAGCGLVLIPRNVPRNSGRARGDI